MALISCPECGAKVSDKAHSCPSCGCPIAAPTVASPTPAALAPAVTVTVTKSRGLYIILGILFGYLGFHNFYSGHYALGAIKLGIIALAIVSSAATGLLFALPLSAVVVLLEIWVVIEVIAVTTDGAGNKMT